MRTYKGKAIYNPSGKAGEYSKWACNLYVGCSNGCTYCYCKKGILAGAMGQDKPQLKKCFIDTQHAIYVFKDEVRKNLAELQEHGLFFSFTTDPLLEEVWYGTTLKAIDFCMKCNIPVKVLTKTGTWEAMRLKIAASCNNWNKSMIAYGSSLTGRDDQEPNAAPNSERAIAVNFMKKEGFKTFASIEPIIEFSDSLEMIKQTVDFCDLYKIGLMAGKKYPKAYAINFYDDVMKQMMDNKVYWKDSFMKLLGVDRGDWYLKSENIVNRDYNIFKAI